MNIYDIAKRSGVSIATVSRVINKSEKVRESTRNRVLEVMHEMNYTPNVFARGLGLNTMHMIGLMCTDVSDIHYAKAVSLMEKDLRARGFDTLLCCSGTEFSDKKKTIELLIKKRVDAIVLIGSAYASRDDAEYIRNAVKSVPVFVINGLVECDNVVSVLCDDRQAMYDNVKLLFENGCREILYVYDIETYSGSQKLSGYIDAITNLGLKKHIVKTEKTLDSAYENVKKVLTDDIDAVIASEDILAIGALKACDKKLPVIGFNNSMLAKCSEPELTSVDNRLDSICPEIAGMLEKLTSGEKLPQKLVFPPILVVRNSFVPKK